MEYFIIGVLAALVIGLWIIVDVAPNMDSDDYSWSDEDTGVDPTHEPVEPVPDFESMTKLELIEYAEENNIIVKKSWNKQRILSKVMDPDAFGTS